MNLSVAVLCFELENSGIHTLYYLQYLIIGKVFVWIFNKLGPL